MSRARLGFCASVAVIAAAIADPLVEFGSNAGWFGPGSFTDRSNLDVVPSLLAGVALLVIFFARRARALLAGRLPGRARELIPVAAVMQMGVLYVMETAEQYATAGHLLGGTIWLGGPIPISLSIHVAVCIAVTAALLSLRRVLAETALRAIAFIVAIVSPSASNPQPLAAREAARLCAKIRFPALGTIGERAPPATA
jgi:hypothetical protein